MGDIILSENNDLLNTPKIILNSKELEVDGTQIIKEGLEIYGKSILSDHFPQAVDGLKVLYKRIIWMGKHFPSTGATGMQAIAAVKTLHDHSDTSIYDTIVRLSQEHRFNPKLINFFGSNGPYMRNKPASGRYISLTLSQFTHDVFFKGIDLNSIPTKQGTDLQVREPKHLIPAIPMAFLMGNITVGYGFASKAVQCNIGDICDLTVAYCNHVSKYGKHIRFPIEKHAEKLIPDFAIDGVITNHKELLSEYKKGNFTDPIYLDGHVKITKDVIMLYTLPVGKEFNVVDKIRQAITDAKSKRDKNSANMWIESNVMDAHANNDHVAIILKRNGVSVFDVWARVKKLIGFSDTFIPNPNYVNTTGYINVVSPVNILEIWYNARVDIVMSSKRRELKSLAEKIKSVEALLIIGGHTDKVIQIIREYSLTQAIVLLSKTFNLTESQSIYLTTAQLSTLSKTSKEELKLKHVALVSKFKDVQKSLILVPKEMALTAKNIKSKYNSERITKLPKYIGYASVLGGLIQFEKVDEIADILESFPRTQINIHIHSGTNMFYIGSNGKMSTNLTSKYIVGGDIYGLPFNLDKTYTVNINEDKTGCCVKGIVPGFRNKGYFYTSANSITVERNGKIEFTKIKNVISKRKKICRGAMTDIIHVYPATENTHYLITSSDSDINVITLHRINSTTEKLHVTPAGKLYVQDHISGKDWYLSINSSCLKRVNTRVFHIVDAEELLGDNNQIRIELTSPKWKRGNSLFKQLV